MRKENVRVGEYYFTQISGALALVKVLAERKKDGRTFWKIERATPVKPDLQLSPRSAAALHLTRNPSREIAARVTGKLTYPDCCHMHSIADMVQADLKDKPCSANANRYGKLV